MLGAFQFLRDRANILLLGFLEEIGPPLAALSLHSRATSVSEAQLSLFRCPPFLFVTDITPIR